MSEIVNIKMLDSRLQKMLNAYGTIPERDPVSARRTQARFMVELNQNFVEQTVRKPGVGWLVITAWVAKLARVKVDLIPSIGKRAISYTFITLIAFAIFLFGGVGTTAYAANSSLPGDRLYSLKITIENVRAQLTADPAVQARLYLDFAARRLVEIQALINEGRFADIGQAASEFEREIQNVLDAAESLSQADPAQAVALKVEIAGALRSYSDILTQMLAGIPGEAQPAIRSAINASESPAGLPDVNGDDDDNIGGRRVEDDCGTTSPDANGIPDSSTAQAADDDNCGRPSRDAGGTMQDTPEPPATNSGSKKDNGNGGGGGGNGNGDDDDNDDDDGGDDDGDDG